MHMGFRMIKVKILPLKPTICTHLHCEANRREPGPGILRDRSQGDTQTWGSPDVQLDVCSSVLFWIYCVDPHGRMRVNELKCVIAFWNFDYYLL